MPEFVCDVNENYRSACEGLDFYGARKGKRYCVLHFLSEEKSEDFRRVLESKLAQKDYDFGGTIFPDGTSNFEGAEFDGSVQFTGAAFLGTASFLRAQFSGKTYFRRAWFGGESNFTYAQFSGSTDFGDAQFRHKMTSFNAAEFSGQWTDFSDTQFSGEVTRFNGAKFSSKRTSFYSTQFSKTTAFRGAEFSGQETDFSEVEFSGEATSFQGAQFGSAKTSFHETTFAKEVTFTGATFREKVDFLGSKVHPVFRSEAWAQFDRVLIEKPEQFTFNTVLLHPGTFINTDVRKVDFTDVK